MTCRNKWLVPDLQYWFSYLIKTSNMNKCLAPFPAVVDSSLFKNNCFIRLLFDENWPIDQETYSYLFEPTNILNVPADYRTRLMVYPQDGVYYQPIDSSTEGSNIFYLEDDDLRLLDKLVEYRTDSTSVTIIDIDYDSLNTTLSKLIYQYLDLKLNGNYSRIDITTPISNSENVLENCYELFINEILFNFISNRGT